MTTQDRGFAAMDDQKQHDIASKGGRASQGTGNKDTAPERNKTTQGSNNGGRHVPSRSEASRGGQNSH